MARFIDSCVVGVNVWGNRPRRFVEPINRISEISISDHVRPFGVWISIICLRIVLINHCCIVVRRLVIIRLDDEINKDGIIMINTTIGSPIIVGAAKEANRFSFIFFLMGILLILSVFFCS